MNKIILTFDLEYWFESLSVQKYLKGNEQENIEVITDKILQTLKNHKTKATFFITGKVLDKVPDLIKKIKNNGHEISIHSIDHQPLWQKNQKDFDLEIKKIIGKIQDLTGQKPIGHRAVNFSLDKKTSWALKVLANNGIKYDSSVFPFKLPRILPGFKKSIYGLNCNQFIPYKISLENLKKEDLNSPISEFPISVWHFGKIKIPLTGGIYIRVIPWFIFKILLKNKLKKETACILFHPFDFFPKPPKIKMPKFKKFIKFFNTKNTWKKFEYISKNFNCISIEQHLHENPSH